MIRHWTHKINRCETVSSDGDVVSSNKSGIVIFTYNNYVLCANFNSVKCRGNKTQLVAFYWILLQTTDITAHLQKWLPPDIVICSFVLLAWFRKNYWTNFHHTWRRDGVWAWDESIKFWCRCRINPVSLCLTMKSFLLHFYDEKYTVMCIAEPLWTHGLYLVLTDWYLTDVFL